MTRRRIPCLWCDQTLPSNRRLKDHVNKHHRIGPVSQQPPVRTKPDPPPKPSLPTYEKIARGSRIPIEVWRQETNPAFWDMVVPLPSDLRKASKVHLTTYFAQLVQDLDHEMPEGECFRDLVYDWTEGLGRWTTHELRRVHRAFREELVRLSIERKAGHLDMAL
ncbi:hypothetical protein F5X96DRAFT_660456 [Biscogniauxia mediterranea]|nr:hypothetical protein F5X96DRAFT_660456 [Biscogniauxia mediterranea]